VLTIMTMVVAFTFVFTFGYWAIVLVSLSCLPIMMSGMVLLLITLIILITLITYPDYPNYPNYLNYPNRFSSLRD
jgi:hypothetical protein